MKDLKLAYSKLLELLVSFKVWTITGASVLLWHGKITDTVWSTVVLGVALGRVALEGLAQMKGTGTPPLEDPDVR